MTGITDQYDWLTLLINMNDRHWLMWMTGFWSEQIIGIDQYKVLKHICTLLVAWYFYRSTKWWFICYSKSWQYPSVPQWERYVCSRCLCQQQHSHHLMRSMRIDIYWLFGTSPSIARGHKKYYVMVTEIIIQYGPLWCHWLR